MKKETFILNITGEQLEITKKQYNEVLRIMNNLKNKDWTQSQTGTLDKTFDDGERWETTYYLGFHNTDLVVTRRIKND